jgi:hypothetical protein
MRIAAPILLTACLLATGCTPAPSGPTPAQQKSIKDRETSRQAEVDSLKGWNRLFGAPDAAIGAANQFGFRPTPYASTGDSWQSTGGPVMIAGSEAEKPNTVSFAAEGPDAATVDTIRFDLATNDPQSAPDARKRMATMVRDYLFRAGIKADAMMPAIEQGKPARGSLGATPYSIEMLHAFDGSSEHLVVTFVRSGASALTNRQTQGR